MRTLTTNEAIALCEWADENHDQNWGGWGNYPVGGCAFLQFDNNDLVFKFDEMTKFGTLKFKRIGWGRKIPGKEPSITFFHLKYELLDMGVEIKNIN